MYIYRFINFENKIIYIGKTKHLERRIYTHFSKEGHLPDECYLECESIDILKMETELEMDIYEIFLINKYSPKYNTVSNYQEETSLSLKIHENWLNYNEFDLIKNKYRYIKEKELFLLQLKKDFNELKNIQDTLINRIKAIEDNINYFDKNKKFETNTSFISIADEKHLYTLNKILSKISNNEIEEGVYFRYENNKELLALDLKNIFINILNESSVDKRSFVIFLKKSGLNANDFYKGLSLNGKVRKVYVINTTKAYEMIEKYI